MQYKNFEISEIIFEMRFSLDFNIINGFSV